MRRLTIDKFIKRSSIIHNKFYNYSKIKYINNKTKVCIICPKHGEFWQRPDMHLQGRGCPFCKRDKIGNFHRDSKNIFISKAIKIHGNKYDYSNVDYKHSNEKVCIICLDHGEFWQTPHNHLSGNGCRKCRSNKLSKEYSSNTVDFIEKSLNIHRDKYDYSKVEYINNKTKVCIICPEHGEFYQIANNHLRGTGCPICLESKGEKRIRNFLMNNNIKFESQKTFKNCKNKYLLPFDFYIPSKKILIEYDGVQHFKAMNCFGGKNGYLKLIKNDNIKNNFCIKQNIKLLRIPYKKYNNIESILESFMGGC